jgi:hypothetical protein
MCLEQMHSVNGLMLHGIDIARRRDIPRILVTPLSIPSEAAIAGPV